MAVGAIRSGSAAVNPDIQWSRFVAYALFVIGSFVWIQARRGRGRAGTVLGVVGLFVAFALLLRLPELLDFF